MTVIVNVQEAKTRLSELLRQVERGESVAIARAGTVVARLQAVEPVRRSFDRPLLPGIPPAPADELLTPMSENELEAWECGHAGDPLLEGGA
ncbi:type II toxin-antitoxin system prevent-host-death family antitoxin [Leucobacter sp. CSA1]|uniref:Type II toxin-antitoxin system prevent-host-death family antitoxin n=1 Tax=Leucobacter chromiisoli TaxID=2796471 RepID=A0A934QAJ6_9MICO|nr:type II toxin-antitoxin system prevent-host-death family antitoxin [Leucobacter chromiisoli]MBK0419634.1 type II toxin-antitoxin system prevent-host-death family antitoxin [Leucobacter chromiisoli]